MNLESKPRFFKSSFSFLQKTLFFSCFIHVGMRQTTPPPSIPIFFILYSYGYAADNSTPFNPWCCYYGLTGLKGLMMSQEKF